MQKTWQERLQSIGNLPKIAKVEKAMLGAKVGDHMLIAPPIAYDEEIRKIPYGEVKTVVQIRTELAAKAKADITCPLTAGIFVNIIAHAAEEQAAQGVKDTTPWWRAVKANGELNEKYPGGMEEQAKRLEAEGRKIICKGKKKYVVI